MPRTEEQRPTFDFDTCCNSNLSCLFSVSEEIFFIISLSLDETLIYPYDVFMCNSLLNIFASVFVNKRFSSAGVNYVRLVREKNAALSVWKQ